MFSPTDVSGPLISVDEIQHDDRAEDDGDDGEGVRPPPQEREHQRHGEHERDRTPRRHRTKDAFEYGGQHQDSDQCPVPPDPCRGRGSSWLVSQRPDHAADHDPSLGNRRRCTSAERTRRAPFHRPGRSPTSAADVHSASRRHADGHGSRADANDRGGRPMMSQSLYRLGHLAARRPWVVIGSWLVLAVVVVGASGAFGHRLKDSMQVPGLDSQQASELMAAAGATDAGLTAQVVVTPLDDDATFFDSAAGAGQRSPLCSERRRGAAPRPQGDRGRVAGRARRADPPAVPARGRALGRGPQQPQGVRC